MMIHTQLLVNNFYPKFQHKIQHVIVTMSIIIKVIEVVVIIIVIIVITVITVITAILILGINDYYY